MVILALGYQLHFSINSGPFFLRFAKPADLQWLMPVFWIGFNIAMFPASVVTKRRGGVVVMGAAGLHGALGGLGAELAGSLNVLIVAQFLAGAAWGCMLMSAVSAALAIGDSGAEGKVRSGVFRAGTGDLRADGGGCRRPAKAARIRTAIALGAGCVLVGRRRGPAGDCSVAGEARRAAGGQSLELNNEARHART